MRRQGSIPPIFPQAGHALERGPAQVGDHLPASARLTRQGQDHPFRSSSPCRSDRGRRQDRAVIVEKTVRDGRLARGTGETYAIPCGLVVTCIGYQTADRRRALQNTEAASPQRGVIGGGLYCVAGAAWADRTIGPTAGRYEVRRRSSPSWAVGRAEEGRPGSTGCSNPPAFDIVTFRMAADRSGRGGGAREGSPRESSS